MKKILFLTKYDNLGASSRYRFYQFFEFYEKEGFECIKRSFFNDAYLIDKYKANKSSPAKVLLAFIKRFLVLFSLFKYDKVVIEKELFPYFPAIFEKILNLVGVKYIVDYDDALFHQYDNHYSKWVRKLLGNKIAKVMRYSSLVVAGNDYLADYAIQSGAKNIQLIPTVIDLRRYPKEYKDYVYDKPIIGWIGTPSTVKYVHDLISVFEKLYKKIPFTLHIIGANLDADVNFDHKSIKWSEETEVKEIQKFDIGIMPLPDSPWERGKCGFKLIQYMGCSKPVVASPVGVNSIIVKIDENGFLATDLDQWFSSLLTLLSTPSARTEMGKKSRLLVENQYCIDAVVESQFSNFW